MKLDSDEIRRLEDVAYEIRRLSVEMITYATWGHIGGSFSMAELLSVLYFRQMRVDNKNPRTEERDRLILSKAHASPGLYAALALRGYFQEADLFTYCENEGLEGHTHIHSGKGIESSGGPLGMGLSVAVGMALGLRQKENPISRVFCIMGDGEMNEGNIWEAAMSAAHYRLDNLIGILDYNKVMAKGYLWKQMGIEPIADKWRAFGWQVVEIDGHSIPDIDAALHRARWILPNGSPVVIIAHTVKGKGIPETEFNYKWHTHAPSDEQAERMLKEMAREYGRPEQGYSRLDAANTKGTFYGGE